MGSAAFAKAGQGVRGPLSDCLLLPAPSCSLKFLLHNCGKRLVYLHGNIQFNQSSHQRQET